MSYRLRAHPAAQSFNVTSAFDFTGSLKFLG
jgi:hypothetical protein